MAADKLNPKNFSFSKKKMSNTISTGADAEKMAGLPGFDPAAYLAINQDVATAGIDPAKHYRDHGCAELRRIQKIGTRLNHPQSRALSGSERSNWLEALRARSKATPLTQIIATHPRAGWLKTGFTLSGYLARRQDLAGFIDEPLQAAFHYLEYGLEEGFDGEHDMIDPAWVRDTYKIEVSYEDPESGYVIRDALQQLFKKRKSPLKIELQEADHWELLGISGAKMTQIFDHEYYHAVASRAGMAPKDHGRRTCIAHFLSVGMDAVLPIHRDHNFDAGFYADLMSETHLAADFLLSDAKLLQSLPVSVLYGHWVKRGTRAGLAANFKVWAEQSFGQAVPDALLDGGLDVFKLVSILPADANNRQTLTHIHTNPLPALAAIDRSDPMVVEWVVDLADRAARDGFPDNAEGLYWLVLETDPNHGRALRHLSDLQQRKGATSMVQALRSQVSEADNTPWNHLALAESYLESGRHDDAAAQLAYVPVPASDVAFGAKCAELARRLFYAVWHNIGPHVAAHGIPKTQAHLRAALKACTPTYSTAKRSRVVKKVALVGNMDLYQCKLYRVDQKAEQLRAAGFDVTVYSASADLDAFVANVDDYQAAIFFRVPSMPPMINAIITAAQSGALTFYEIDDIVFDTAHFPPSFESYAGQIDEGHYAAMACGVPLFEHAMTLCDYGIASTATIKTLMESKVRTGQVFEHHNALSRMHLAAVKQDQAENGGRKKGTPLVLFYGSGTKAHKEDFHDILEPALAEIVRRYGEKVEIRLIGHFGDFKHLNMKKDPVKLIEPMWDFDEYCSRVAEADINLSVLTASLLTDAKSEIKWMEAGMFGIPSVVSATATHRETIVDGETGFLAQTTAEFITALDRLVSDDDLRTTIGEAARAKVMATYGVAQLGQNLRNVFEQLRPVVAPKPRLMVVNVFFPPQSIGGATRVVHDNIKIIADQYGDKYEIDVVCTLEGGSTPYNIDTYAIDGVRVWAITAPGLDGGDMQTRNPQMGEVFGSLVDRLAPDLVHFHCIQRLTVSAVEAVRYRDIPYLITLHDGWWISPNQFLINDKDTEQYYDFRPEAKDNLPARAQTLARALRGATKLLAVSPQFAEIYESCGLTNVAVNENGVSPLIAVDRTPSLSGRVRLAHIGGAVRHKGVHLVRNALLSTSYDNLELLLIDHAMQSGTFRSEVWGNTPVTITGKVSQAEVANLYSQVDILLAPSIWPESYGLVTREASTLGTWVVTSDRGAIGGDVTEGENGHLVDVSSYKELAQCFANIDADPARYLASPETPPVLRRAEDQVVELIAIYDEIFQGS